MPMPTPGARAGAGWWLRSKSGGGSALAVAANVMPQQKIAVADIIVRADVAVPGGLRSLRGSHVVVEREFIRCRPEVIGRKLIIPLVVDPRLNQIRREDASLGEVIVDVRQPVDDRGWLCVICRDDCGILWL